MKILITGTSGDSLTGKILSGKLPEVGREYLLEDARYGSSGQNRLFHKLVRMYFDSGCHSYPATTFWELRQFILLHLGRGFESFIYVTDEGALAKVRSKEDIPEHIRRDRARVMGKLWKWSDYTMTHRRETISSLSNEMIQAGVSHPDFESILKEVFEGERNEEPQASG